MPFDGLPSDYEVKKPAIFSLEGLIAWLETQNPATRYPCFPPEDCLLGRWNAAHGRDAIATVTLPEAEQKRLYRAALSGEYTYGAALTRARSLATQGRE